MSKSSEGVIRWRKRTKKKVVAAMGGCCQICGYNKCDEALELHHINPEEKEYSFGRMRATPQSIKVLTEELKKCILLCSNCHREVHNGVAEIPESFAKLNEEHLISEAEISKRLKQQKSIIDKIPIDRRKIFFDNTQLEDMLKTNFGGNKSALARFLNVSETSIRKRLKNNGPIAQ